MTKIKSDCSNEGQQTRAKTNNVQYQKRKKQTVEQRKIERKRESGKKGEKAISNPNSETTK